MYTREQIVLPSTWCLRLSWTRLQIVLGVKTDSLSLIFVSHGFQYYVNAIIISIIMIYFIFSSIELSLQNKIVLRREKKAQIIQDGDRKCGTHARVSSQTLAHGNSKNEIVKEKWSRQEKNHKHGKKYSSPQNLCQIIYSLNHYLVSWSQLPCITSYRCQQEYPSGLG